MVGDNDLSHCYRPIQKKKVLNVQKMCECIINNLQIDIHKTDTIASVNIINKKQVLDYDGGTRCSLYKANVS